MGRLKKINIVLNDLMKLNYYAGLNSGRWEQNEYDRVSTTQKWNCFVERMAEEYGIGFNHDNVNFEDEYELDEFTYELNQNIESKLKEIIICNL